MQDFQGFRKDTFNPYMYYLSEVSVFMHIAAITSIPSSWKNGLISLLKEVVKGQDIEERKLLLLKTKILGLWCKDCSFFHYPSKVIVLLISIHRKVPSSFSQSKTNEETKLMGRLYRLVDKNEVSKLLSSLRLFLFVLNLSSWTSESYFSTFILLSEVSCYCQFCTLFT